MVRRLRFICIFLGILILCPSWAFAAAELGEEGIFDEIVQNPAFNLWLPGDWDPIGHNILRPIEECIPRLDISGLFRTRIQVMLHDRPFAHMAPGQGGGTHPLMWQVEPTGAPLNGAAGDYGERIEFRVPVWEQLFELEFNYRISNNWRFNLILNQTYNAAYDVNSNMHHFFNHWHNVNEWQYYSTGERIVKDCWLDYKSPFGAPLDYSVRIGKQFVVWGKVDGARIMDIINPEDFREGPQHAGNGGADWEYFKLGLWMVNFYTAWTDYNFQLLVIPDFEENRIPLRVLTGGHPWEFEIPHMEENRMGFTGAMVPALNSYKKPSDLTWDNTEVGVRFGFIKRGWEVQFSYFYTWSDMPVPFNGGYVPFDVIAPGAFPPNSALVLKDVRHTRLHQLGINYEKQFFFPNWGKGIIFKGEARYDINPYWETDDPTNFRGFEQHNTWLIAIPNIQIPIEPLWTAVCRLDTRIIEGYHHGLYDLPLQMDARRVSNSLTLALTKFAFKNRLFVFSHAAWDMNRNGWWIHSTWNWEFIDKVKGQIEFNIYEGSHNLTGEFDRRDNITFGLEYRFD